ncbi:MAG: hypothetical protein JWL59_308 [Chthoniobacteraceae bacterium]|nr:hypothetical protein [Chthoniobacteraceae bacterium]
MRREAIKRLKALNERDTALKFLQKNGLAGIPESLERLEKKIDQIVSVPAPAPQEPPPATVKRGDFYEEITRFYDLLACKSEKTKGGWGTYHRALVDLVKTIKKAGKEDISALEPWEKVERLGPSGLWAAYKATHKGRPASPIHDVPEKARAQLHR